MDKKLIDKVLLNQGDPTESRKVARWFGSPEGQLDLSSRIDAEWEALNNNQQTSAPSHSKKSHWRRALMYAAAVVLLLLMGSVVGQLINTAVQPDVEMREVCVQRGEQLQVMLPDGTKVYLNSGSRIAFPSRFDEKQRTITLAGEAYFDVTKDKHHPFIVEMSESSIEVLGTRFNVSAYTDETVRVALDEGKVRFHSPQQDVTMRPGEVLCYNRSNGRLTVQNNQDTRMASAWTSHRLEVQDMPMRDLINILSRRYDVTFAVQDEACYENSFSLSMSDSDLRSIIRNMVYMSPIRAQYDPENRVVTISNRK